MKVWKRNMYTLWVGNFMFFIGISMVVPFLPIYVQDLGVADMKKAALWASAIFAVNHLFLTIFSPIWGRVTDKIGQKPVLMASGALMGLIVFTMGFSRTPLDLLVLRMLFGMTGGFSVAATALVAVQTPAEHRGKTLGTMHTGIVLGQMIGPLFGGLLASTVGMRSAFYLTGLLMLASAILVAVFVRETAEYKHIGAGDVKEQSYTWHGLFRYPMVPLIFLTSFLLMACSQSIDPLMTLYIKSIISDHVEIIGGLVFAASALGTMISAPLLGRIGDKQGHMLILIVSLAVIAVTYIMQSLVHSPWQLIAIRFITGACFGGLMPAISALLSNMVPKRMQGGLLGINSGASSFGCVIGAVSGGLLANLYSFHLVFYIISILLALHSMFLFFVFRRKESIESIRQPRQAQIDH